MKLGAVTRGIFPELNILQPIGGEMFYVAGMFTGLIIWGFALLWLWFALASFATRKMKFSLGWWALVFPSAAFVLATAQLGKEFDFLVFRILATVRSFFAFCHESHFPPRVSAFLHFPSQFLVLSFH